MEEYVYHNNYKCKRIDLLTFLKDLLKRFIKDILVLNFEKHLLWKQLVIKEHYLTYDIYLKVTMWALFIIDLTNVLILNLTMTRFFVVKTLDLMSRSENINELLNDEHTRTCFRDNTQLLTHSYILLHSMTLSNITVDGVVELASLNNYHMKLPRLVQEFWNERK